MIRHLLSPHWLDVYDDFRFELRCSLPRLRRRNRRIKTSTQHLHLGCYDKLLEGFLNTDATERPGIVGVDLRLPLPFEDHCFRGVYAHHVVEHLSYLHAWQLFRETKRVLQAGGILRIVVPDAQKFIRAYLLNPSTAEGVAGLLPKHHRSEEWKTALEVVDYAFRDRKFNRHRSAWDEPTFRYRLKEAGFTEVRQVECNHSIDPIMCGLDNPSWAAHSLYIEAVA